MDLLKIVFKLLVDKARDKLSEKLKQGDSSEETLRGLVIREAAEIRERLKSLALKDLDSAASFLERGLRAMKNYKDNAREDTKEYAMKCFTSCSELATQAFCNKSLEIKDRILAMKINVSSTILQLESNPKMATDMCLNHFLKDLNALPAVERSFDRHYGSAGLVKFWKAGKREEIVTAVEQINQGVKDFIFLNNVEVNFDQWPTVQAENKNYIPFKLYRYDNANSVCSYIINAREWDFVEVNRRRQLVRCKENKHGIDILFLNLDTGLNNEFHHEGERKLNIEGMTLDEYDNIYIGVTYREEGQEWLWGLFVEVFSPECHHLKTITVIRRQSGKICIDLSASAGKLCVTSYRDLWIFTIATDSDQAISHKKFEMIIIQCWIYGEKIILRTFSNLIVLHSSLQDERIVDFEQHSIDKRFTLDRRTGYLLSEDLYLSRYEVVPFVITQYGKCVQSINLPYPNNSYKSGKKCTILPIITGTIKDEMTVILTLTSHRKVIVFTVSE